jgi:hypothetical protein
MRKPAANSRRLLLVDGGPWIEQEGRHNPADASALIKFGGSRTVPGELWRRLFSDLPGPPSGGEVRIEGQSS